MVVASGWWVAIVQLTPAADRPYIGGSQNNSILNLIFGYNGFGRLTGNETGSVGGAGITGSTWGPTGLTRLFNASFGGQVSWLLPAALILLVAGLVFTLRRGRTDRTRAAFILWGGSLVVSALVFSLAAGIIHPYYTVALAPAIGALVGIGSVLLWRERSRTWARLVLAGTVAVTSIWSVVLLERSPDFAPGLAPAVAILASARRLRSPAFRCCIDVWWQGARRRYGSGVRGTGRLHNRHRADGALGRHSVSRADDHRGNDGRWRGRRARRLRGPRGRRSFPGGFGRGGFPPGGGFGNPGGFTAEAASRAVPVPVAVVSAVEAGS